MTKPTRHYKLGEEPHDTLAWQGGNIGPDVPEPPSTLGVQLFRAKLALEGGRLEEAADAIDAALWHYDNDKLSDIGAQIIE